MGRGVKVCGKFGDTDGPPPLILPRKGEGNAPSVLQAQADTFSMFQKNWTGEGIMPLTLSR